MWMVQDDVIDVRVWICAKDDAEVAVFHPSRHSGTFVGVVSWWSFDNLVLFDNMRHILLLVDLYVHICYILNRVYFILLSCYAEQSCIQFSLLLECWCSVLYFISFIFYYLTNYSDSRSRSHTQICIHVCVYTCVFAEKSHTFESRLVLFIGSFNYFILFVFYMSLLIGCSVSSYWFIYFILIVCRIILFILIG